MESNLYIVAMLMTVGSNIGYHYCQKSINPNADPLISLAATYVVALIATLIAIPFFRSASSPSGMEIFSQLNWATYGLGIALVGLELGFLLAYRAGWNVSIAALYSNLLVTVLLLPIGFFVFSERLSKQQGLGLLLAIIGLWLLKGK